MKLNFIILAALACATGAQAQVLTDTLQAHQLQDVVVKAVRATKDAPFAVTNISKQQLRNFSNTGRELPLLFANTPGVLAWGENGLGTGTAYMRIRGAAGSRINVTLDGVSLNSPEDQTVFWANMNSYGSLLGSVQIQRGIGTSTHGDGAFGGSISLASAAPNERQFIELTSSYGSYNTYHAGANFSTGLLWNHLIFDGAYHETGTNGFIHGTAGRSGSYYGGLTWFNNKLQIRYKNIGNFEKTGQAWNGVVAGNSDASLMDQGIKTYQDMWNHGLGRFNSLYEGLVFDKTSKKFPQDANGNFQTFRYRMDDGSLWNRTTDNFYQNHNIASVLWQPSAHWTHNAAIHYTYGYGYYREFRPDYKFAKFGMYATNAAGTMVKLSDFVRRKGLSQHTYGLLYNTNYVNGQWDVMAGLNLQHFKGSHFGYVDYISTRTGYTHIDKPYAGNRYYDSDASKHDYSLFAKADYHITEQWDVFGDVQYRLVRYKTSGINDRFTKISSAPYFKNQALDINRTFSFLNPKAGISFHQGGHKAYFSVACANREPERNNFTDNGSYPAPTAERLFDYEMGYAYAAQNWHVSLNLYYMDYHNQFVQTGEKSDIGEYLTTNIPLSHRLGAEISADYSPLSWLTIAGNAALSQNKIEDFTEYAEDWGAAKGFRTIHYDRSTLAFSPAVIANGFITARWKGLTATWHTNFVSRQFLDNTQNDDRSLPCFSQSNFSANYAFNNIKCCGLKALSLGLNLNNVFNRHYAASGGVYSAYRHATDLDTDPRYYQIGFVPMAGFNMMGNITLTF